MFRWNYLYALLLLLAFSLPIDASAQTRSKLVLSTPSTRLETLEPFAVRVLVEESPDVYGIESHLRFDPTMLQVIDADIATAGIQVQPGAFINPLSSSVFLLQNQADNSAGTLDYSLSLVAPASAVQGSGTLMTVTFQPLGKGRTKIEVVDSLMVSPDVTEIDHSADALSIAIGTSFLPIEGNLLWVIVLGLLILLLLIFLIYQARAIRRLQQNR